MWVTGCSIWQLHENNILFYLYKFLHCIKHILINKIKKAPNPIENRLEFGTCKLGFIAVYSTLNSSSLMPVLALYSMIFIVKF